MLAGDSRDEIDALEERVHLDTILSRQRERVSSLTRHAELVSSAFASTWGSAARRPLHARGGLEDAPPWTALPPRPCRRTSTRRAATRAAVGPAAPFRCAAPRRLALQRPRPSRFVFLCGRCRRPPRRIAASPPRVEPPQVFFARGLPPGTACAGGARHTATAQATTRAACAGVGC